jgi:DNA modification methylase
VFLGASHFARRLPEDGSWLAWDKSEGGTGPKDTFVDCEFAWCSVPGIKRNILHHLYKGVACRKAGEDNGRRLHAQQKPVRLMRWCIRLLGLPLDAVILDPYMGVGTTIVAALREGYRAIGIEVDPGYCELARRRQAHEIQDPSPDAEP